MRRQDLVVGGGDQPQEHVKHEQHLGVGTASRLILFEASAVRLSCIPATKVCVGLDTDSIGTRKEGDVFASSQEMGVIANKQKS